MHKNFLRNLIISSTAIVGLAGYPVSSNAMDNDGNHNQTHTVGAVYAPGDEEKYQDDNGRWHAANGQFTTEPEVESEYTGIYIPYHVWEHMDD